MAMMRGITVVERVDLRPPEVLGHGVSMLDASSAHLRSSVTRDSFE